jgi:hypothetical protein
VDVKVKLEGADRLIRLVQNATSPAQQQALKQAVFGTATAVLNESKKLVPVDTEALKSSGRVENMKISSSEVSVEITYGGPAAKYAFIVHEDMSANHSPSLLTQVTKRPRRGQAKYLEIPVMAWKGKFVKSLIGRYVRYFKKES